MKSLVEIQSKLNVPKDRDNTFGGYKYRNAEDILKAVKPLLTGSGYVLTLSDEIEERGGRVYVKATARLSHEDPNNHESISVTAYAREEEAKKGMDASQITGAASSYARKYALCGLFAIDDGIDADTLNNSAEYTKKPVKQPEMSAAEKADRYNYETFIRDRVEHATTKAELKAIWDETPMLHQYPFFTQELSARKKALGL